MSRFDLADQRAFAEGQSVFAPTDQLGFVSLAGPDALALTCAITTLPDAALPPTGQDCLVLDGQGHILFGLTVLPEGDSLLLVTDGPADQLADFFNKRRFRRRAAAAARQDLTALITPGLIPPSAIGTADGAATLRLAVQWPGPVPPAPSYGPRYARATNHPGLALRGASIYIYPRRSNLAGQLGSRGYRQIDVATLDALRIAAHLPLASCEAADGRTVPHELDWLRTTTALEQGCYPGQEAVAKIVNVGKPPRRLVFLHLDGSGSVLPQPGAPVLLAAQGRPRRGDSQPDSHPGNQRDNQPDSQSGNQPGNNAASQADVIGQVTSVGMHFELGPVALAVIRRTTPADAPLAVQVADEPEGWVAASQTEIVPVNGRSDARPLSTHKPMITRSARAGPDARITTGPKVSNASGPSTAIKRS